MYIFKFHHYVEGIAVAYALHMLQIPQLSSCLWVVFHEVRHHVPVEEPDDGAPEGGIVCLLCQTGTRLHCSFLYKKLNQFEGSSCPPTSRYPFVVGWGSSFPSFTSSVSMSI